MHREVHTDTEAAPNRGTPPDCSLVVFSEEGFRSQKGLRKFGNL